MQLPFREAFQATLVLSVVAGLGAALLHVRKAPAPPSQPRRRPLLAAFAHPWTQFLLVIGALFVNQILVNAYIRVEQHADAWFVTRWLGPGWFAIAPYSAPVSWTVEHLPFPVAWLEVSILRVQAFLELPFALFAYLTVARMLDRAVYRALTRSLMVAFASISFTVTFCLVELILRNPWTDSDLVVRLVSCAATPFWIAFVTRLEGSRVSLPASDGRPRTLIGLLGFFAGAAAIAALVLVVYDVALLYNFEHLHKYWRVLLVTIAVATAVVAGSRKVDAIAARAGGASSGVHTIASALSVFTFLFFVPSLVVRYFGYAPATWALATALVLAGIAGGAVVGARAAARAGGSELVRWSIGAAGALAFGAWCAWTDAAGLFAYPDALAEALLLRKSMLMLAGAAVAWRAIERATRLVLPAARRQPLSSG